ncbi:MAG: hypothetical protein QOF55_930, partial [Thermoleophilaceae bacterium]|nr:hypothetical protein [Thermoleophilaceae bacterium]
VDEPVAAAPSLDISLADSPALVVP